MGQLSVIPRTFKIDLPQALVEASLKCQTEDAIKELGVEWAVQQCNELIAAGVPGIHFYSVNAVQSVCRIAAQIY